MILFDENYLSGSYEAALRRELIEEITAEVLRETARRVERETFAKAKRETAKKCSTQARSL